MGGRLTCWTNVNWQWERFVAQTAGLRFFFVRTLKRRFPPDSIPYPKDTHHRVPKVLSSEEVAQLIDAASNLQARAILMLLYSTGMRRSELVHLRVEDIDSKRMIVHIRQGKGGKDRDVPLCPRLLETHRIAISNHRLLAFAGQRVTFRWKDYAHGSKQRKMTLDATEFLRRIRPNPAFRIPRQPIPQQPARALPATAPSQSRRSRGSAKSGRNPIQLAVSPLPWANEIVL